MPEIKCFCHCHIGKWISSLDCQCFHGMHQTKCSHCESPKPAQLAEEKTDTNLISDGYHTFGELYEHRFALYIALCRLLSTKYKLQIDGEGVWRSKLHSDGSSYEGWFVLGILTVPGQQITYHLPIKFWDKTDFAQTLDKAPEFDGHTSNDVIQRLYNL